MGFWQALLMFGLGVGFRPAVRYLDVKMDDPPEGPYDWARDGGLLDVWARERIGELVAVIRR